MNISTLAFFCQRAEMAKIAVDQMTIKGKHSNRLSFTVPNQHNDQVVFMCSQLRYNCYTTTDAFIDGTVFTRWQVDLV